MYRINPRRTVAALGMSLAVAMVAAAQISPAQTPRNLPANPESQGRVLNRQQDAQFDRQYRGQYDQRDTRSPEDRLGRRLAYLHGQLRITPAQETAWTAFTATLRDEARDSDRDRVQGGAFNDRDQFRGRPDRRDDRAGDGWQGPPSVVERLVERRRMIADQGTDLDHILTALRPLYASFSTEQRQTADRLMFQPRGEAARRGFDDGSRDRGDSGRDGRVDPRDDRGSRDYR